MAGRKPVPTKLKVLTGNPGKRPINRKEPEPPRGIPAMPGWLEDFPVAVAEWRRESEILDGMGILTMAEEGILAMHCYLMAQIQEIAAEINKEGRVAYTSRMDSLGNEVMDAKPNPKAVQIKNMITEYRQIGSLLGFDPVSRVKMATDPKEKEGKYDRLLNNAKARK